MVVVDLPVDTDVPVEPLLPPEPVDVVVVRTFPVDPVDEPVVLRLMVGGDTLLPVLTLEGMFMIDDELPEVVPVLTVDVATDVWVLIFETDTLLLVLPVLPACTTVEALALLVLYEGLVATLELL